MKCIFYTMIAFKTNLKFLAFYDIVDQSFFGIRMKQLRLSMSDDFCFPGTDIMFKYKQKQITLRQGGLKSVNLPY